MAVRCVVTSGQRELYNYNASEGILQASEMESLRRAAGYTHKYMGSELRRTEYQQNNARTQKYM